MNARDFRIIKDQLEKYEKYALEELVIAKFSECEEDKNEAFRQSQINSAKALALEHLLGLLAEK